MSDIAITKCNTYEQSAVKTALFETLDKIHGLDWVQPGMRIAVKTNLVTGSEPDKAVVTHPAVLVALTELLIERGATVIVGDSPGGPFSAGAVKHAYKLSQLELVEQAGGHLNDNFDQTDASNPEGRIMKQVTYTSWLKEADAVIGVCKLKTHGMMRMSANVKNFFGAIPGTMKLEYHYRFLNHADFADMLVDINEFIKPRLYITDAIVGMEGNGPTAGTPREIGGLLASTDGYSLDQICARIIGLEPMDVPTIKQAAERGLYNTDESTYNIIGSWQDLYIPDYHNIEQTTPISFEKWALPHFMVPVAKKLLQANPQVQSAECIGCEKCKNICPAKAITMQDKKPVIDRDKCIRCFCCQEFCPKGAMKVKRGPLARLISKI